MITLTKQEILHMAIIYHRMMKYDCWDQNTFEMICSYATALTLRKIAYYKRDTFLRRIAHVKKNLG